MLIYQIEYKIFEFWEGVVSVQFLLLLFQGGYKIIPPGFH